MIVKRYELDSYVCSVVLNAEEEIVEKYKSAAVLTESVACLSETGVAPRQGCPTTRPVRAQRFPLCPGRRDGAGKGGGGPRAAPARTEVQKWHSGAGSQQ